MQNATRPLEAWPRALAGTNNAVRGVLGSADVIADADTLVTNAGVAQVPKNTPWQAALAGYVTGTGIVRGALARANAPGTSPSRRRKRQTAGSSWDSEVRCPYWQALLGFDSALLL